MLKIILLNCLFFVASAAVKINAQSIDNRKWKSFVGDPVNDTLTFHIRSDSSYVTDGRGNVMIRSHCKIAGDTLMIEDYGSEPRNCIGRQGLYKIRLNGNSFTLASIQDPCDGRLQALDNRTWMEAKRE